MHQLTIVRGRQSKTKENYLKILEHEGYTIVDIEGETFDSLHFGFTFSDRKNFLIREIGPIIQNKNRGPVRTSALIAVTAEFGKVGDFLDILEVADSFGMDIEIVSTDRSIQPVEGEIISC